MASRLMYTGMTDETYERDTRLQESLGGKGQCMILLEKHTGHDKGAIGDNKGVRGWNEPPP